MFGFLVLLNRGGEEHKKHERSSCFCVRSVSVCMEVGECGVTWGEGGGLWRASGLKWGAGFLGEVLGGVLGGWGGRWAGVGFGWCWVWGWEYLRFVARLRRAGFFLVSHKGFVFSAPVGAGCLCWLMGVLGMRTSVLCGCSGWMIRMGVLGGCSGRRWVI